jgi:hypothetical protein
MSDAFVVVSNLSFAWPDDTPVFDGLSFAIGAGRTGLVASRSARWLSSTGSASAVSSWSGSWARSAEGRSSHSASRRSC